MLPFTTRSFARARIAVSALALLGGIFAAIPAADASPHLPAGTKSAAPGVVYTSCAGPERVITPRPGFQPWHATNEQLLANGYPRRPAGHGLAYRQWASAVKHARYWAPVHPTCGPGHMSTIYDSIWSGHIVPKKDFSNLNIIAVQSQWNVPYVSAGTTTNFRYAPSVGVWTGIGYTDLLQAGSVSAQSSSSPTFKMWTEDFPQNIVYEGPTIHSGNLVFVQVNYEGANQTLYYLENESTGVVDEVNHTTPYVGEADADYILERVNGLQLPKFSDFLVSDNYFWQAGAQHELTKTNNRWDMTSNCTSTGTALAEPTSVSYGEFYQDFYHSSPYSDTC